MELDEIKQYPHKIIKIIINNENKRNESYYEFARFKITIPEKAENEIIIFSYDEDLTTEIPRTKNNDDYFLEIPNVEGETIIYAHFLIADLYDNTEENENDGSFVSYDLTQLKEKGIKNHYEVSQDEHPRVFSILENSSTTNKDKDPNYKQYNSDENNGKRIKGKFPIYSRYSKEQREIIAPDMKQETKAIFTKGNNGVDYSWEARIKRTEIGDIIPEDTNESQYPINVYLNYEYLPTSTEYHQHFYGFEGKETTECRDINVFEGDSLETINSNFFNDVNNDKYTYRLINVGNKADYSNAQYVNHTNTKEIEISSPDIINNTCEWLENSCEGFYTYTALKKDNDRGLYYPIELKPNTSYTLKYYVYIPNDIKDDEIDCYIDVQTANSTGKGVITIGSLNDIFKKQDKFLTNQWVYHEVPFRTTQKDNRLYIKGHTDINKNVYFSKIYIEEFVQYSPTIKYTNQGIFVMEDNKYVRKPNKDYTNKSPDDCTDIDIENQQPLLGEIVEPNTPYDDIFIDFDENFDVEYNSKSKSLFCYPSNGYDMEYYEDNEGNKFLDFIYPDAPNETNINEYNRIVEDPLYPFSIENIEETIITIDENNEEHETTVQHEVLMFDYEIKQVFTYGTNNKIILKVANEHNEAIDKGYTECAITDGQNEEKNIQRDTVKYLGRKYINAEGNIEYNRIDFSKLAHSNDDTYFLRIDYHNPCYNKVIHMFKKVHFIEENLDMSMTVNDASVAHRGAITIHNIEEFPLEIIADIHQAHDETQGTDWGYCELSIDDEVRQTSYVDADGKATFYLNKNADKLQETQVIKIEYYRKYNESIVQRYFTLQLDNSIEGRDAVPIRFNVLTNEYIEQIKDNIEIMWDDCLIIDIDTDTTKGNEDINYDSPNISTINNQYINYSVRLYKTENNIKEYIPLDNDKTYINITSIDNDSVVIGYEFISDEDFNYNTFTNKTIKYTIVTDSLINNITTDNNQEIINYSNNKYRQYSKTFTVTWKR